MLSPEARSPSLKVFNGQTVPIICEDGYTVPNKSSDMLEMSTRAYLQARDPLRNPIIGMCAFVIVIRIVSLLISSLRVVMRVLLRHDIACDNARTAYVDYLVYYR